MYQHLKFYLEKISSGTFLTESEANHAMQLICSEEVCHAQAAAFLAIIHVRGEAQEELLGFIRYLQTQLVTLQHEHLNVIDTCGTGGDHSNTFNISTASALLLASAGIPVAKHGGRSVSSQCGSADVIEMLGIPIQNNSQNAAEILKETSFVFLLASEFSHAYSNIRALRQKLGIRTCFNLLGPLLNPAQVKHQVIGVYSKAVMRPLAEILQTLGSKEVMLVHSHDGLDECSISAPTDVVHLKSTQIHEYTIYPEKLGITQAPLNTLQGGNATKNAKIIRTIFQGEIGPAHESVILNSAAGFIVANRAETFQEGIALARHSIESKKAFQFLNQVAGEK